MMLPKYTLVSQCIHAEEEDKGNDRQADTERLIPNNTSHSRGGSKSHMCKRGFNFDSLNTLNHWINEALSGAAPSSLVNLSALHLQRLHDAGMASGLGPS